MDVKYRELQRETGDADFTEVSSQTYNQVHLGHVPIMLRSDFCSLAEASETALQEVGECPYDQVGVGFMHVLIVGLSLVLIMC